MKWSAWAPLDGAVIGGSTFQVRVAEGLLAYPRGKSAMVYYGNEGFEAFRAQHRGEGLLVRFSSGDVKRELDRFRERFGAPPRFNS